MLLDKALDAAQTAMQAADTAMRDDVQILYEDGRFRTRVYLIANGVPFDAAMAMSEAELSAWMIAFGEEEGNEWDWKACAWKVPEPRRVVLRRRES